jgi:PD-(D/E)XK nuclease superfamily protein
MINGQPNLPTHIDSTMMTCFRSCPQKYYREFVEGRRPAGVSIDLHAGACFASAIEEVRKQVYLNHKPLNDALVIAQARFFQEWGDVAAPEWKRTAKTKDRVWEAVESYFAHYSPLTDHVQPLPQASRGGLEYTFAIPLEPASGLNDGSFPLHPNGGPFLYCGRFDMIGSYQGRPCVCDEKTTGSSIGKSWAYQWDLRSQFIGYVWACQQDVYADLDTVVVRGIAIQKEQIVHAEAIKLYSNDLIAKWHEQLRRDLWRLVRCYEYGYWDYNLGDACTSYGACVFMAACASNQPDVWLQDFEIRHWNPIIRNPIRGDGNAVVSP